MFRDKAGNLSIGKIILAVAVLLALGVLISSSFVVIPAGHTGVVLTFGRVNDVVLQEGLHFKLPFAQQVVTIDLADEGAGSLIGRDVGGVLGEDIAHQLIDRIVAFFFQRIVHFLHDGVDLIVLFVVDRKNSSCVAHAAHPLRNFLHPTLGATLELRPIVHELRPNFKIPGVSLHILTKKRRKFE